MIIEQYWTTPSVHTHYAKPVYVLTSARTFSGGEECADDFQTQKRATLVGETTGGGANPGDHFSITHDFVAFIPTGKAINPVTHSNWEHIGVKPDIATTPADARKTAMILRKLLADARDSDQREELQDILHKVETGVADVPGYAARPQASPCLANQGGASIAPPFFMGRRPTRWRWPILSAPRPDSSAHTHPRRKPHQSRASGGYARPIQPPTRTCRDQESVLRPAHRNRLVPGDPAGRRDLDAHSADRPA